MTYTGRCACGEVKLTISGSPIALRQCWCRRCQTIAAGSPTNNGMFASEDINLAGQLATRDYVAESGNTITQSFCGACGTPVMAQSNARPELRAIRLGMIDAPRDLRPRMAIWTDEAPEWATIDPALEQHRRQPPPPPNPS